MRKYGSLLLAAALLLGLLPGCGQTPGAEAGNGREQVSIALWSDQLTERYAGYLQETFPEVEFTFYVATNSTDFYRFKERMGDLPDILTVRRFALRDVADWKDSLMDLSDTELANTFHQSYLRSYTYEDGTVNWLPACAEVDGIVANRKLLEEHGLSLPTSYQEFVELCGALTEQGVRPFLSNFSADFTCMEILQGLSVSGLTSQEGREWRQRYESGQTDQLSEQVWLPVFERMAEFIDLAGIGAEDLDREHVEVLSSFQSDELGMMRGTGNESAIRESVDGEHVLLPYFGETAEDSWYLTYPAFQIAAGVRGTEDPERKQLILNIMSAMLDQNGLERIASGQNMIPYNKDVTLELSPELDNMEPYIEDNRLYIRLASSDMFSVSYQVVRGMISGEYPDARAAFDAFNQLMSMEAGEPERPIRVETGYPYAFDPRKGSQAASAVMNTLREELGTQLLIGPTVSVSGNISAGDYSQRELSFLTTGDTVSLLLCEMTGEQLYQYMNYLLTTGDRRGSVLNDGTLYVSSGFEMKVKRTQGGYQLERLTVDGKELDRGQTWTVAVLGSDAMQKDALESAGVTEYEKPPEGYKTIITDHLAGGGQLAGPTSYITLG